MQRLTLSMRYAASVTASGSGQPMTAGWLSLRGRTEVNNAAAYLEHAVRGVGDGERQRAAHDGGVALTRLHPPHPRPVSGVRGGP
jgi:hypothetical protein